MWIQKINKHYKVKQKTFNLIHFSKKKNKKKCVKEQMRNNSLTLNPAQCHLTVYSSPKSIHINKKSFKKIFWHGIVEVDSRWHHVYACKGSQGRADWLVQHLSEEHIWSLNKSLQLFWLYSGFRFCPGSWRILRIKASAEWIKHVDLAIFNHFCFKCPKVSLRFRNSTLKKKNLR